MEKSNRIRPARLVLLFSAILIAPLGLARADSSNVEKAIQFLKDACVTSGSSLDLKATGDGSLKVKSILGSGVKGSITLTKKELEGFADAASELSAKQASEMRECMKPYIDKIISAMLSGASSSGPQKISIDTGGGYFVTDEFDKVIATISSDPTEYWSVATTSRVSGVHSAKVNLYFEIGDENDLGDFSDSRKLYFRINKKGLNYVLSRGLVH